jgi:hypothetical protein
MKTLGSNGFFLIVLFLASISAHAEDALDRWYFRDARVVNKVKFVGGLFIGVGNNGMILTSPDGQTWTARNSGTTASLRGIAFGGLFPNPSWYVAVGTSGTILISSNAISWTLVVTTNTCDLNDAVSDGIKFVIGTTRTTTSQPNVLLSQNGTNWTPITFPNLFPGPHGISFGTHSLVAVGSTFFAAGNDNIVSDIWKSSGGTTWQNVRNAGHSIQGIAYGNGRLISIGIEGNALISTNFPSFQTWFSSPYYTNQCFFDSCPLQGSGIAFGNSTFVALHWTSSFSSDPGLIVTTNGLTWSNRSALLTKNLSSITFGNDTFVAAGANGIYQSEPISTPGLSLSKNSSSNAINISVSGKVGRAYRLQTSINISNWFDRLIFTNTSASMEFIEPITNSSGLFYRAVTP